ncbi:hypothetical protein CC2G_002945 [Coprinopsis cinerea AmutBmut pab1-1]|nr:hypothetical protein CC2G_002945 [Coprinopsis cinerea AmutBmut pab1-1]
MSTKDLDSDGGMDSLQASLPELKVLRFEEIIPIDEEDDPALTLVGAHEALRDCPLLEHLSLRCDVLHVPKQVDIRAIALDTLHPISRLRSWNFGAYPIKNGRWASVWLCTTPRWKRLGISGRKTSAYEREAVYVFQTNCSE